MNDDIKIYTRSFKKITTGVAVVKAETKEEAEVIFNTLNYNDETDLHTALEWSDDITEDTS